MITAATILASVATLIVGGGIFFGLVLAIYVFIVKLMVGK